MSSPSWFLVYQFSISWSLPLFSFFVCSWNLLLADEDGGVEGLFHQHCFLFSPIFSLVVLFFGSVSFVRILWSLLFILVSPILGPQKSPVFVCVLASSSAGSLPSFSFLSFYFLSQFFSYFCFVFFFLPLPPRSSPLFSFKETRGHLTSPLLACINGTSWAKTLPTFSAVSLELGWRR